MLTGYLRTLVALTNQEGTNIVDHLYQLKYCRDQLWKFRDKNYRISETLFKGLIVSSLPPSWDQFTDSYVTEQLDEEMTDPKKLIISQEFIGIICQEVEHRDMHATSSIVFLEQLALVQSRKKSRPKPLLATWISGLITDAPQSDNLLSSSKTKKKCKYCNCKGHLVSKCHLLGKPKCQFCGKIGHESDWCWKKNGKHSNDRNEDNGYHG